MKQARRAFVQRLLQLTIEEGFEVKNWDSDEVWPTSNESDALLYLDYLEDRDGQKTVHGRACHNLYSFNFEAGRVRREKKMGNLETFIERRMKSTTYRRTLEYAIGQSNT